MGTASVTILQSVLGKGVWELSHEQESAPLYVKPECGRHSSKPNVSLQFGKDFSLQQGLLLSCQITDASAYVTDSRSKWRLEGLAA